MAAAEKLSYEEISVVYTLLNKQMNGTFEGTWVWEKPKKVPNWSAVSVLGLKEEKEHDLGRKLLDRQRNQDAIAFNEHVTECINLSV